MLIRRRLLLDEIEDEALRKAGFEDLRTPDDQARYFVRQELIRRGLLAPEHPSTPAQETKHAQPQSAAA